MSNRVYNIMFHSHTISGIIISALLYVIFFTGSISFLRDEINAWERDEAIEEDYFQNLDFDAAVDHLESEYQLYGRDISFSQRYHERRLAASMTSSKDTSIAKADNRRAFFYMDLESGENRKYGANYSLGEFFYRLHFFAQLNYFGRSGYMLAGLVAFFFLFAIVTGVIVHWKKISSSFFVFRPKAKWKTIWTDAHVALGILGLPYQFIFAVTGTYLIIGYTFMLPPVKTILFGDDKEKMAEVLDPDEDEELALTYNVLKDLPSIQPYVVATAEKWPEAEIQQLQILNYGDESMRVKVSVRPKYQSSLMGSGFVLYDGISGEVINENDPFLSTSYIEGATNLIQRLHFGDYGGYGMKLIYFCLGIISCFVIISGVLIWLVARDKKNIHPRKRKFNTWLGYIYLSSCLSLYPATAIAFIAVKVWGYDLGEGRKAFINEVFFWPWLVLSLFFIIKRNNYFTQYMTLLLGAVLGAIVPLANGWMTGNWPWVSFVKGYDQIFVVDVFWLLLSITSFLVLLKMKKKENPIIQSKVKVSEKVKNSEWSIKTSV
ncbi:PepSY-associated TM helix domain-containing protein [Membranihabitans marinus]|uniref:PepSY-associated TM helix domain-containing protein n=1 Tax=Membranihabitans marinus TaxID=1227546 RepID=UPI001F2840AA|nr:PepSY-associated TM helix domain-containing protein [Membranihabitans marinus]